MDDHFSGMPSGTSGLYNPCFAGHVWFSYGTGTPSEGDLCQCGKMRFHVEICKECGSHISKPIPVLPIISVNPSDVELVKALYDNRYNNLTVKELREKFLKDGRSFEESHTDLATNEKYLKIKRFFKVLSDNDFKSPEDKQQEMERYCSENNISMKDLIEYERSNTENNAIDRGL